MYFSSAPIYGCTDWRAENYDPLAMIDDSSCTYANCAEDYGYAIYKNGSMVGSTTDNFHTFLGLVNGTEYELGVAAIYESGNSEISTITEVPVSYTHLTLPTNDRV